MTEFVLDKAMYWMTPTTQRDFEQDIALSKANQRMDILLEVRKLFSFCECYKRN